MAAAGITGVLSCSFIMFFSTLSLYDYVFCVGAAISAILSNKTYYASRRAEN